MVPTLSVNYDNLMSYLRRGMRRQLACIFFEASSKCKEKVTKSRAIDRKPSEA
jgi:hypothetical protein